MGILAMFHHQHPDLPEMIYRQRDLGADTDASSPKFAE
jgi:hypothetical protein